MNLAAIAEARLGAARDVDDFVLVWIGRGVGLAVVLGGRLHRGAAGVAGEIGYLYVPGGPLPDDTRVGNPRGVTPSFQQTINEKTIRALAREHGFRAATAADAVAAAVAGGRRGRAGARRAGPAGRARRGGGLCRARPAAGGAGRRRRQRRRRGAGRPGAGAGGPARPGRPAGRRHRGPGRPGAPGRPADRPRRPPARRSSPPPSA